MKNYLVSVLSLLATASLVISTASCSERRKEADPVVKSAEANPAPTPAVPATDSETLPIATATPAAAPADLFTQAAATLENVTRDQVAVLTPLPEALNRSIDASIAAWKAKGGASTTMAESKFDLARTNFAQKVRTLSLAGDDTWKSAKADAQSALEDIRTAYGELMAGKERN